MPLLDATDKKQKKTKKEFPMNKYTNLFVRLFEMNET